jgi:TRAP-type transport system periplasmic protein
MKHIFKAFFIAILLMGLIGCSANTSTNSSSNTTDSGSSSDKGSNENEKQYNLVASVHSPPGIPLTKAWNAYLDEIEKRSEGQIKFERYDSGSLAGALDVIGAVESGIADLALVFPSLQKGKLELNQVTANPGISDNAWTSIKAMNELEKVIPELSEEFEKNGTVNIGNFASAPAYLISTKPLGSFDSLKGLRVLASAKNTADISTALGMVPNAIQLTDSYDALTKGTIDTVVFSAQGAMSFGLHEAAKNAWKLPMSITSGFYVMNKDVWDSLPEHLQTVIQEVKEEFQPESFHKEYQLIEAEYEKKFIDAGGKIIEPTEEDLEFLMDIIAKNAWDGWKAAIEEKGLPGEKTFNTYKELVEKYEKENPFK